MLEVGKTYPLDDGSGAGTVVAACFMVKISRPGKRYNGEVQHYDADGKYIGSLSWETPALLGGAEQGAKPKDNAEPHCHRFTSGCLKCNGCQYTEPRSGCQPAIPPRDYTKPFGTACHFCDQIEHPKDDGPVPGVGCRWCHLGHCISRAQPLGGPGCVCMKEHPFGTGGDQSVKIDFPFTWAKGKPTDADRLANYAAIAKDEAAKEAKKIVDDARTESGGTPDEEESVWKE